MEDLNDVYNELIMEHSMNSYNKKKLEKADYCEVGHNPNCGDEITLELKLNGDIIEDMAFSGHGCAISQASTSIMIDVLKGKTVEEAKEIIKTFIDMIKRENEILEYARNELSKLEFLKLYFTPNKENHSSVISFNINGVHPHDVASILDSYNICVRSGNHCAQPLMRFLGIDSTCRASFYIYNTKEDVDKLVQALKKAYEMFEKYIIK